MAGATLTLAAVASILVLLGLSAFFSSAETAIFSLPPDWIADQAEGPNPNAARLVALRADPHRLLVTILVGNNLVNVAMSSVVTVLLLDRLPPGAAVVAATLAVSAVVLVFGEIVPKSYGLGKARSWSLRVAHPLTILELALAPAVAVFDRLTRWLTRAIGGEAGIERPYLE